MKQNMTDTIKDNAFLFVIVLSGGIILAIGYAPPYHDMLIALGAAFIIAGAVGIYMMLATRQVAKKLHERFNVQNDILHKLDEKSEKQNDILHKLDEKSEKQNDILHKLDEKSEKQNDILHKLDEKSEKQNGILKDMASSQKDMASSQKQNHSEMIAILKKIEQKL